MTEETDYNEIQALKKNRQLFNKYVRVILVFGLFAVFFWLGKASERNFPATPIPAINIEEATIVNKDSKIVDFGLFWKTWDLLKSKYVDSEKLDANKLLYGAIQGMLRATGDPYTSFLNPEENQQFSEDIQGSFEGIGAEMAIKSDILTIVSPLSESPAEKAGLRPGDKILKINEDITAEITIDEAVKRIRGPRGTEVKLTIFREGEESTQEIIVKRDVINVKSVELTFKEGSIAYLKVSRFGNETEKEFDYAVNKIVQANPKGIILDLRNNPGGYLESAVNMSGKMLPKDKIVVIEESARGDRKNIPSPGPDKLSSYKTVVLINEGSASASEIMAGALRENRSNVTLAGMKSFGKGTVQEFIELPQNTAVKITVAKWLTPNGNQINETGIKPDVEIDLTKEDFDNDRDPQLEKALEILRN